jgi:hypothetical protein
VETARGETAGMSAYTQATPLVAKEEVFSYPLVTVDMERGLSCLFARVMLRLL